MTETDVAWKKLPQQRKSEWLQILPHHKDQH